jgi:hypothetical protein
MLLVGSSMGELDSQEVKGHQTLSKMSKAGCRNCRNDALNENGKEDVHLTKRLKYSYQVLLENCS